MKVPVEWLKEFVAVRLAPEALAERLTMAGLEVTGVAQAGGGAVLELEVTPNRADCLSILGVAREAAAVTGQRLKVPKQETGNRRQAQQSQTRLEIAIEDREGCARYIGRLLEGVRIGPSPAWMQRRLIACGARPINNVVDITNYVLLELGQPLHAFDAQRLAGGRLVVRRARESEPITTLDGVARKLPASALVIADARQPVAVAGVMGGTHSEVTAATTQVLLESALFDPLTVRRTARSLGLASESSYRFERGVDPAGVERASARAAALIRELAGGREVAALDVGRKPGARAAISLSCDRASRWLGVRVAPASARTTLARLSCRAASSGESQSLRVTPPSFRLDLAQEVDLYEELARMMGYDRISARAPVGVLRQGDEGSAAFWRTQSLRCLCASLGLMEAVTWSLISEAEASRCGIAPRQTAKLANPLSQDHAVIRPSLLPGLLQAVRRNLTQGASSVRVFEVGNVIPPDAVRERRALGLALTGHWARDWHATQSDGFFRLKGLIEALTGQLCDGETTLSAEPTPWGEPGQTAVVRVANCDVGQIGQVAQTLAQALDIEQPVWFAELSVEDLAAVRRQARHMIAPPTVPPVKRDLSFIVDRSRPFDTLARLIREAGAPLAEQVELIDQYAGPQIPAGQSSLTFSIAYRDPVRTLTAAEVDAVHRRIGQALMQRAGAALR